MRSNIQRRRSSDLDGAWFVYAALCPASEGEVLVKVGISTVPYDRLYTINNNCPYPIELAYFAMVGRKKAALTVERAVLREFSEHKTRGEWLRLDTSEITKKRFSFAMKAAIRFETGSAPDWRKATGEQIRLAGNAKLGDYFQRFPGT